MYHQLYLNFDYARDYEYESQLEISKSDYIENTIGKLPEVFKNLIFVSNIPSSPTRRSTEDKETARRNKIRPLGQGEVRNGSPIIRKRTTQP